MAKNDIRLLLLKDGIVKEIDPESLPVNVVHLLMEEYDRKKIVGISADTYYQMLIAMSEQLKAYRRELETTDAGMFRHAVAFANGCYVDPQESALLFEIFCWIDRNLTERETFTSRDVNMKQIREYLKGRHGKCSYADLNRDFKNWAKQLFSSRGVNRIGFIKMAKLFFAIASNHNLDVMLNA